MVLAIVTGEAVVGCVGIACLVPSGGPLSRTCGAEESGFIAHRVITDDERRIIHHVCRLNSPTHVEQICQIINAVKVAVQG